MALIRAAPTSARRPGRAQRAALRAAVVLAVTLSVAYLVICAYMGSTLTRPFRRAFTSVPEQFGLAYEAVSFPSRVDRLVLDGWLLAPGAGVPERRMVVVAHGWARDRQSELEGRLLEVAARLVREGHPVLLFDLRGWGRSEGDRFTLGGKEVRDVGGAIDFLTARGLTARGVNLYGMSMGAATSLLVAPNEPLVRAVVPDSSYADLGDVLAEQVPKQSGLPAFFTPGTLLMAGLFAGVDPATIRPVDGMAALAARGTPVLIVQGDADHFVAPGHGRRLAAAYGPGAETYFVPGARHVLSYEADPTTYLDRLTRFLAAAEARDP